MAAPSLTYTLTNGTTADASQVMQNFNDLLNGYTDGTKDLSISALTVAGTATLNGNVALGNSSADDITVTGSLASTLPIKTTNTYDIGSSTIGLRALFFGANSQTAKIVGNTAMSGAVVLTLPSATDTLVGKATTDILTNKDISATTNTYRSASASVTGAVSFEAASTATITWSSNLVGSATSTLRYARSGSVVTLIVGSSTADTTSAGAAYVGSSGTPVPSGYRPAVNTFCYCATINTGGAGTVQPSVVMVLTTGEIRLYKDNGTGTYAATGWSMSSFCFSYPVN